MLQNLQKSLLQSEIVQNEQIAQLTKQLDDSDRLLSENQQHKQKLDLANEDYNARIQELLQQISSIKDEIDQYQEQINQFNQTIMQKKQSISKAKGQKVNPQLKRKHDMYENMLKMKLEFLDDDGIKVTFTDINPHNRSREYWAVIEQLSEGYRVPKMSDALAGIEEFEAESQMTGNLGLLVRRLRRGFAQQAASQEHE